MHKEEGDEEEGGNGDVCFPLRVRFLRLDEEFHVCGCVFMKREEAKRARKSTLSKGRNIFCWCGKRVEGLWLFFCFLSREALTTAREHRCLAQSFPSPSFPLFLPFSPFPLLHVHCLPPAVFISLSPLLFFFSSFPVHKTHPFIISPQDNNKQQPCSPAVPSPLSPVPCARPRRQLLPSPRVPRRRS